LIKFSTLAQTPSFSASTGHLPEDGGVPLDGGVGQLPFGGGGGGGGAHFALARTKKRRLTARKSVALDAIVNI
jgi:hypothetical protein